MEGKLYKTDESYFLEIINERIGKIIIASSCESGRLLNHYKLSLSNCESIQSRYDLDELAKKSAKTCEDCDVSVFRAGHYDGFKEGAKAILELDKDKLFTISDISYAIAFSSTMKASEIVKKLLKQPTEWNVEILMEKMNLDEIREQGKGFLNASTEKPKLDLYGCLILKIVK